MQIKNKRQILTTITSVLVSIFLVATAVYAVTTIGNDVSVGGNLTVGGEIVGYVPYTGATGDVDLGEYNLTTNRYLSAEVITVGAVNALSYLTIGSGWIDESGGIYRFLNPLMNHYASLDFSLINDIDKIFTFPDASGTLALEMNTIRKLAMVENIDFKVLGETLIYTVPANTKLIVTALVVRTKTYDTINGDGVAVLKRGSDDAVLFSPNSGELGMGGVGSFIPYASIQGLGVAFPVVLGGDTVEIEITTAETGTALTFDVDLIGYLIED